MEESFLSDLFSKLRDMEPCITDRRIMRSRNMVEDLGRIIFVKKKKVVLEYTDISLYRSRGMVHESTLKAIIMENKQIWNINRH